MVKKARKSLGTQGVRDFKSGSNIGYVVIPEDQDRDAFIKNCYRTSTIMIRDEFGSSYKNVFVTDQVIQEISFPESANQLGSAVVYAMIQKHSIPIVFGTLKLKNQMPLIMGHDEFRLQKRVDGDLVDFFASAQRSEVDLSVSSSKSGKGKVRTAIVNPDSTAEYELFVKGLISLITDKDFVLKSNKTIELKVSSESGETLSSIKYVRGEGYVITDEYSNKITLKNGSILLERSNGLKLNLSQKINLGSENSQYTGVLGEKLVQLLNQLISATASITVPTPSGVSGTPNNALQLLQLQNQLQDLLSSKVKLD